MQIVGRGNKKSKIKQQALLDSSWYWKSFLVR